MVRPLALLAPLSLVLLAATPGVAAEWHAPAGATRHAGTPSQVARAYLTSRTSALGLAGVDLVERAVLPLSSYRTVRYVQRHAGLPVIGTGAAVRVAPDGRVVVTVLDVARHLTVSSAPLVSATDARAVVRARRAEAATASLPTTLAVLQTADGAGRLVWQIDVRTVDGGYRHLVDARVGTLVHERPLAIHALGRVYPISSVSTPQTQDLELPDLVVSTPQYLNGWSGNLTVTNYVSGDSMSGYVLEQTVEPNSGEDFLYDPPTDPSDATDAFAQVGIYYHMTRMRDFYAGDLGLDMTGSSWKLTAAANLLDGGQPMANAFFSEQGAEAPFASANLIGIGQGSTVDFAVDSDVFLHEFTHYVSHNAIGFNGGQAYSNEYGMSPFGGSIDEGISDYFACTENDDPILGEATLAVSGSERDLTDTSKTCPADMFGEVHLDGEIIGSFSWTLRDELGKAAADQLVWGASTLLTPDASFGDYGRAVVQTANDLVTEGTLTAEDVATIEAALATRGLDECDAELPLLEGEPQEITLSGLDMVGQYFGANCEQVKSFGVSLQSLFHYAVTPDPAATGLSFDVTMNGIGNGAMSWSIYARQGEHVSFNASGFMPEVADYDYAVEGVTGPAATLVIDETSDPPFDPNTTYHAVLVHQNCPNATAIISTSPVEPAAGGGGAGGGGAGGGPAATPTEVDDGCGCRTAGSSRPRLPPASWGLVLAALALAYRRRRAVR